MKTDLVIFDCDGVLIDSEIIAHRVNVAEVSKIGGFITIEDSIKTFTGLSNEKTYEILEKKCNTSIPTEFLKKLKKEVIVALQNTLRPIKNIHSVIQYLNNKNIQKCIASNSPPEYLKLTLSITDLANFFKKKHVYSASMVKQGKPEPDLFLHAADKMKVKPQNCLIIEDSIYGIAAAKAAKMPVIGFLGGTHAKYSWYKNMIEKTQPSAIADDANALLSLLKTCIER